MTQQDAPPTSPSPTRPKRRGRPAFGLVVLFAVGFRLFREVLEWVARSAWGPVGALAVAAAAIAVVLLWRADQRRRAKARGGVEHTPEMVRQQVLDSELVPAFAEDGTIAGASLLVVNQLPKVLEVQTQYELFASDGNRLGAIEQIAQSRGKQTARVLTPFDQFFTHHFEMRDAEGHNVLRCTRPAKLFKSSLHVFDGDDRHLGTWRQQNMFWKIRWALVGPQGQQLALLQATQLRAWDFHVDAGSREVATIVKSWEGWGRTAFSRADRYVVRVEEGLSTELRLLLFSCPLAIDQSLKQDTRGIG